MTVRSRGRAILWKHEQDRIAQLRVRLAAMARRKQDIERTPGMPSEFLALSHPTLVGKPPAGGDWIHEIKYDGFRFQLNVAGGAAKWFTRNGLDWTEKLASHSKDAEALERAHAVTVVAFDKTGTLTEGKPRVTDIIPAEGLDRAALLRLSASLQQGSEHPLARAVRELAEAEGIAPAALTDFKALAGRGVSGAVGGRSVQLGTRRLMAESGLKSEVLGARAAELEASGRTVSWLAEVAPEKRVLALIAFGDTIKEAARDAVRALHDQGIEAVMVTGDSKGAAEAVARDLGIDRVFAEVLPGDKADVVATLKREGKVVAMVGDGINDAPALAAADIGIAMGTGTDVAMATAGVTLMRGDPVLVGGAIDVSRRTYAKIRQGLFWAFIYNLVGIPLAALGFLSPVLAGAAMALSSVSVVLNALTLRGWKPRGT